MTGPTSPPDHSNTLTKIHVNNWADVSLLDIAEFHLGTGTACTGITSGLHVEYTTKGRAAAIRISPTSHSQW